MMDLQAYMYILTDTSQTCMILSEKRIDFKHETGNEILHGSNARGSCVKNFPSNLTFLHLSVCLLGCILQVQGFEKRKWNIDWKFGIVSFRFAII